MRVTATSGLGVRALWILARRRRAAAALGPGSRPLRDRLCAAIEVLEGTYRGPGHDLLEAGRVRCSARGDARAVAAARWQRCAGACSRRSGSTSPRSGASSSPTSRPACPGRRSRRRFWASGISLVAHPRNPHVPPAHMNTRHVSTSRGWFGGGADLNPILPYPEDTAAFHAALKAACDARDPGLPRPLQGLGGRVFLHPAPRRGAWRGRHLLRLSRGRFRARPGVHPGGRRCLRRHLPAPGGSADGDRLERSRETGTACASAAVTSSSTCSTIAERSSGCAPAAIPRQSSCPLPPLVAWP